MEEKVIKMWEKIKKICKRSVKDVEFNTFFQNVEAGSFEDNLLTLNCSTLLIKQNMEKHKNKIEETAEIIYEEEIKVEFQVVKKPEPLREETRIVEYREERKTGLNLKNRLDNFVVGENSKLAYNACLAVVENDIPVYNPLFIYGGSGLGKTHLMQAVGNAILERNPNKRVYYCTSEEFSNEFYKVLKDGMIQNFRDSFRALDVLLLDDIQFFERVFGRGEGAVEEEFFHTFNKLQASGKQIMMISDKYPKEIKNLSKRLETRFLSGLSVEIQQPGFETRMAILKNIVIMRNIDIDDDILEFIADSVDTNVRELEGILTLMSARSKLLDERITIEQIKEEMSNRVKVQQSKMTAEKIMEIVAREYSVTVADLKSKKRQKNIVIPRQVAMYLLKNKLDLNLTTIGGLFGGKDHSTVISSIRKVDTQITEDTVFRKEVDKVRQKIGS